MKNLKESLKRRFSRENKLNGIKSPMRVLLRKEIAEHIRSWRFIILLTLILLTFTASMYSSLSNIKSAFMSSENSKESLFYLKLLTLTDDTIPPFHIFLSFLAPILGISLGFDAINSEHNNGSLIRLMAQPLYRDNVIVAKFIAPLLIVAVLFLALTFLIVGYAMYISGIPIEWQEIVRIIAFNGMTVLYVGFWLSIAILLSIRFKQPATSALTAIGIWLFFTIFFQVVVNIAIKAFIPDPNYLSADKIAYYNEIILNVLRISPNQLYVDASTTLLMPTVRSLGPVSMEQMVAAIPSTISVRNSLMLVWPQLSGLIAFTLLMFATSYYLFMRREIRS
ncbi:ABC-2 type transport system permease protein [Sphingobacterium nematocida]|uniref:ABC-2 type transport system permease protein n=1 Tax=Sphingobacterium nematocida TaxID=1513896 RepID=A0A1T5F5T1_9SPHI|nr:ABC transporter permease subunit [Sphingobacterium nematocida]SKB91481.1 ABC-2 type transport system permease protein [Sphingobacterium nematocida]